MESADTRKRERESDMPVLKRTDGLCGVARRHFISFSGGGYSERQKPSHYIFIHKLMALMASHLAELQASPHVGHFSHLSPDAPGTEHTQWPHSHLPRPLQSTPSSDAHASVPVLQLQ